MGRILAFLAWPLIEIALFVVIGGRIGLWATLAWVILTAVAGIFILRFEAARGAVLMRDGLGGRGLPEGAPVAGLMRALAAVLLILPGFLTDAFGLLLLLPPLQALVSGAVMKRVKIIRPGSAQGFGAGRNWPRGEDSGVIDGEWVEVPPEANRNRRPPSGWTEIDG